MGSGAPPKFNDVALSRTVGNAVEELTSRVRRLDAISEDIKALETYLNECGLRIETSTMVEEDEGCREFLEWRKAEPDRWRIVYRSSNADLGRPLIEAKSDARLRMGPFLPQLVAAIASRARENPDDVKRVEPDRG